MSNKRKKIRQEILKKVDQLNKERTELNKMYDINPYVVHFNHGMIDGLYWALYIIDAELVKKGDKNGK